MARLLRLLDMGMVVSSQFLQRPKHEEIVRSFLVYVCRIFGDCIHLLFRAKVPLLLYLFVINKT